MSAVCRSSAATARELRGIDGLGQMHLESGGKRLLPLVLGIAPADPLRSARGRVPEVAASASGSVTVNVVPQPGPGRRRGAKKRD